MLRQSREKSQRCWALGFLMAVVVYSYVFIRFRYKVDSKSNIMSRSPMDVMDDTDDYVRYLASRGQTSDWFREISLQRNFSFVEPVKGIFIFSAYFTDTPEELASNNAVVVNVMETPRIGANDSRDYIIHSLNRNYKCCYYYQDYTGAVRNVSEMFLGRRHRSYGNQEMGPITNRQFLCPSVLPSRSTLSQAVTLTLPSASCPDVTDKYVLVRFAEKRPGEMAINGKVVHLAKSAEELIEWFEFHRYFGIKKFLLYVYKGTAPLTRKVLEFYEALGVLDLVYIHEVPLQETYPRTWAVDDPFQENDDQMFLADALERLRGFTYAIAMDTEEFLFPLDHNIHSLSNMMTSLLLGEPNATGFRFMDHAHLTTWGRSNDTGDMIVTQFLYRTQAIWDHTKTAYMTGRVRPGGITPRDGFKMVDAPPEVVVIKRYGPCELSWIQDTSVYPNRCLAGFQRYKDWGMLRVADKIRENVRKVRKLIGLEETNL